MVYPSYAIARECNAKDLASFVIRFTEGLSFGGGESVGGGE